MSGIGGSLLEVIIRGRIFAVAADSDSTTKLGGYDTEVQANGNGTARKIMTRVPWKKDGISLSIDDTKDDLEFLQEVQNSKIDETFVFTHVSGASYTGKGSITGDLGSSSQNATAALAFAGPGALKRM